VKNRGYIYLEMKIKGDTKRTLISVLLVSAIIGFIFLSSLWTDTDFGVAGYVFLLIFFSFIVGLVIVFLRLVGVIKNRKRLFYNFLGVLNVSIPVLFFICLVFQGLWGPGSFSFFYLAMFSLQLVFGVFILWDIFLIGRRTSEIEEMK
jgi:hypothetical protein